MKQFLFVSIIVLMLVAPTYVAAQTTTETTQTPVSGFTVPAVKAWFSKMYAKTEVFRTKQAVYFATMRDDLKKTLKIEQQEKDNTITVGIAGADDDTPKAYAKMDNPLDYAKYIFATSMASMFANELIFYVTALLLTLLVVRFVISRLV